MSSRLFVALLACMPAAMYAADSVTLTLPEAVRLALAQNRALKIARLKVQEKEQKKAGARAASQGPGSSTTLVLQQSTYLYVMLTVEAPAKDEVALSTVGRGTWIDGSSRPVTRRGCGGSWPRRGAPHGQRRSSSSRSSSVDCSTG